MSLYKWVQNSAVVLAAVILFISLWQGVHAGGLSARTRAVLDNAQAITKGLDYFNSDQGRYPSMQEFSDGNIMSRYFSGYPFRDIDGGNCVASYYYHSIIPYKSYELQFCLPQKSGNFPAGANILQH